MWPILEPCYLFWIFPKEYKSAAWRALELTLEAYANYPKYIIGTYFETELSTFVLAPSASEEEAKSP